MELLTDSWNRTIRNCRISVTDRCNLRCTYCMPARPEWLPQTEVLTFEEIVRFVRVAVSLGIDKFRLTGGEPTARKDFVELVRLVAAVPGVRDLSMTTNGLLLAKLAGPLWESGLRRINVSLDTLREEKFVHITRRSGFAQVLEGLEAAVRTGFAPIKVNVVAMRGVNDDEILEFAALARTRPYQVRFIEFMPLDGDRTWSREKVVPAAEILDRIRAAHPIEPANNAASEPARVWRFSDGAGDLGIIASVTEPFCWSCDRVRLTAEGKLRTCLFSTWETDLRALLRGGVDDAGIARAITGAVAKKEAGHGIHDPSFVQPPRAMYAIGG